MPSILLATCADLPRGEPGAEQLETALATAGVRVEWAVWDDADVDWASADLVAVRSTWDYQDRLGEFLAWTQTTEAVTRLVNDATAIAWNVDKSYLLDLATRVPVVPTQVVGRTELSAGLSAGLTRWGRVVVKPTVGASGVGVLVAESPAVLDDPGLGAGPWLLQPLVDSVRTTGETSVFVCAGRGVAQVDKRPAAGEIRVHEEYGGASAAVALDPVRAEVAEAAAAATGLAEAPAYARVDLMWWQGEWVVGELELVEPGLYLDVEPATAAPYAAALVALL